MAPAFHDRLREFRWQYLAAILALGASYVVATCLNDIFDLDVDRINHPGARDRPLVTGDATQRQLVAVAIAVALIALLAGSVVGVAGTILITASLLLNVAYSVPPVRLCSRPLAAPLVLAFAYVVLPYGLGMAAAGLTPGSMDARVMGCFVVLFIGRMLLKDFRDRAGDAAFGKRTFLLTYGKPATLGLVLSCVLAGDALLLTVVPRNTVLLLVVEGYFAGVLFELYRLWRASERAAEQMAIALGARMGNAVVLTLLGSLLMSASGAAPVEVAAFVLALAGLFWFGFAYTSLRPQEALAAYRG
jgi:4-hydroxybenzoate polyprenyltransferase